jgi:FkbM family methyltransferase
MSVFDFFRGKDYTTKTYKIGEASILLNAEHNLPKYQAKHPLYDQFLPVLAGILPDDGGWLIDVGANVGDTAAALCQRCRNPVLSIEGDPTFYSLLVENGRQFGKQLTTAQALVGTGRLSGSLVQDGTTATRKEGQEASSISLDTILAQHSVDQVALLKTDTDGFDMDIVMSCAVTLRKSRPLVFWENEFQTREQFELLEEGYEYLAGLGYSHVWIFDNFGFPILEDVGFAELRQLNRYMAGMLAMNTPPSIFYIDVLASTPDKRHLAVHAMNEYRKLIPMIA